MNSTSNGITGTPWLQWLRSETDYVNSAIKKAETYAGALQQVEYS